MQMQIRRAYGPGRVRSWARSHYTLFLVAPLPPQWISGPQMTHPDAWRGLRWATLQITETITWALPNRPDQISTMSQFQTEIS